MLAGCGGSATASEPEPVVTPTATEAPLDVEAIARDEIAALDALGYPTELATWEFLDDYTNSAGGTATTNGDLEGHSVVRMSTDPDVYTQFSVEPEEAVRSTVRHEFGHALTYWLYPDGAEYPLSKICLSVSTSSLKEQAPAGECAAEAANIMLSEQRGGPRVSFYGLNVSQASLDAMRPIVEGSLTW